jgi:hypothetical protein
LFSGGLNPATNAKLPKKMAANANSQTLKQQRLALQILFLVEQREVRFVTSVFHLVYRNEMKSGGVNHVAFSRGRLRVGKDMAKTRITALCADLGSLHLV